MSALVVEVDGRVLRLEGKSVFRLGRAIEADVVLTAPSVSRQHAELRAAGEGWVLHDVGSSGGTFVEGRKVTEQAISQSTVVRCGPAAPGAELTIVPADQYDASSVTPSIPAPPPPVAGAESFTAPTGLEPADSPATQVAAAQPGSERFAPPGAAPAPGAPAAPAGPPPVPHAAPPAAGPPPGARPPAAPGLPPAVLGNEATQVLAAAPRPGHAPAGYQQPQPPRTGPDLLLVAEGREYRFRHPAQITVGRRTDCTVVISDPACSRLHGRVDAHPGGWTYTNQSNEGTFLEGRRVTTSRFDERTSFRLGHPVAGPELTLVPILSAAEEERRFARRRWGKRLAVIGVIAAGLLLVLGLVGTTVWLVSRDDDKDPSGPSAGSSELDGAELEAAKAATVKIVAESHLLENPSIDVTYHGSGSIIRSDGLILTNAHVADPEARGLEETYGDDDAIASPEYLLISLTDGMDDTNAPAAYRAKVVASDGRLDAAVIQIYAEADGDDLEGELDLPTVAIGDSADVRAGDDVTVLGFPAVAGSGRSITVTTGVISTVDADPDLGDGAEFDTDARIAPGNSGGMAVNNDGELIGIPTALFFDQSSPVNSGRIRTIDAVKDLIEEAEEEAGR